MKLKQLFSVTFIGLFTIFFLILGCKSSFYKPTSIVVFPPLVVLDWTLNPLLGKDDLPDIHLRRRVPLSNEDKLFFDDLWVDISRQLAFDEIPISFAQQTLNQDGYDVSLVVDTYQKGAYTYIPQDGIVIPFYETKFLRHIADLYHWDMGVTLFFSFVDDYNKVRLDVDCLWFKTGYRQRLTYTETLAEVPRNEALVIQHRTYKRRLFGRLVNTPENVKQAMLSLVNQGAEGVKELILNGSSH